MMLWLLLGAYGVGWAYNTGRIARGMIGKCIRETWTWRDNTSIDKDVQWGRDGETVLYAGIAATIWPLMALWDVTKGLWWTVGLPFRGFSKLLLRVIPKNDYELAKDREEQKKRQAALTKELAELTETIEGWNPPTEVVAASEVDLLTVDDTNRIAVKDPQEFGEFRAEEHVEGTQPRGRVELRSERRERSRQQHY